MSIDNLLSGVQSITNEIGTGANTVARLGADLGLGGISQSSASAWFAQLRPASWRGVPFGVFGGRIQVGRRNAVHTYPQRDTIWVEDLGRSGRRIQMSGFLVGDDVIARRERLIAACEQKGDGLLVHPTLGELTVSLFGPCEIEERWDRGRVFEISFSFVESGQRVFPASTNATGDAVKNACTAADAACAADFATSTTSTLQHGAAVVKQAASTAAAYGREVQRVVNGATNLYNLVGSLPGDFGRLFGAKRAPGTKSTLDTVQSLVAAGVVARQAIATASTAMTTVAQELGL